MAKPNLPKPGSFSSQENMYLMWMYVAAHEKFNNRPMKELKQIAMEISELSQLMPFNSASTEFGPGAFKKVCENLKLKWLFANETNVVFIRNTFYKKGMKINPGGEDTKQLTRYSPRKLMPTLFYLVDKLSGWQLKKRGEYDFINMSWKLLEAKR